MPRRIAVVGAGGFFGRALCAALASADEQVAAVTRETFAEHQRHEFDIVINTATPSRRYWARQHPALDFTETVQKTADLLYGWRYARFIQISSVSARCERESVYGRHKAAAEALCERDDCLIVRLTALYGPGMNKGALVDIAADRPVYVAGDSRYAFTPVSFAAEWVASHLDQLGLIEIGARNTISLREVAEHVGKTIQFSGPTELQEVQHPLPSFPDAREALTFVDRLR